MIALIVDGKIALGRDSKFELKESMGKFALPLTMPKVGEVFGVGFYPPETPGVVNDLLNEAFGRLQFGDKCETFATDISYWKIPQYTKQWQEGLQRLVDGASNTCLLVSVNSPHDKEHGVVDWWRMYRDGDSVRVVHQMNALVELENETFDVTNPYKHIQPRINDGVYEWKTTMGAIRNFLNQLK